MDIEALMGNPIAYSEARGQIVSGDLLFLHHSFVPTLYGWQIEAVQEFTGPFAHVAILDRVTLGGEERVCVWESVVPKFRLVPITATIEDTSGFFWLHLNKPMSPEEIGAAWALTGKGEYSKPGAVRAGLVYCGMAEMPDGEDADSRMWCAKAENILRRISGVDSGPYYVPTPIAEHHINQGAVLRYVSMKG